MSIANLYVFYSFAFFSFRLGFSCDDSLSTFTKGDHVQQSVTVLLKLRSFLLLFCLFVYKCVPRFKKIKYFYFEHTRAKAT